MTKKPSLSMWEGGSADVKPSAKISCIQLFLTPIITSPNSSSRILTAGWPTQDLRESSLSYAEDSGLFMGKRLSANININVLNAILAFRTGVATTQSSPKWRTFHLPIYGSIAQHSTPQAWTVLDCFGPYLIKMDGAQKSIIFKCLTTHVVHLDLLANMDTDSFLVALCRFIARRGKPFELLSDQGTNFKGGSAELKEAFSSLIPSLQAQLASQQQIHFQLNPPHAPHFGSASRKRNFLFMARCVPAYPG
ncbi:hypothetical protein L3Q82_005716 [Scortum barcoo]|uniref:Uncharacterized protein n=1 Tax=Scortum barcoo TaxID=214431 RepID=A0ACB8V6T0_9TELE|nr:hypothetical protein L3Q82_005716 [Scortum barcoo]